MGNENQNGDRMKTFRGRPCEKGKPCKYETFDYSHDMVVCGIDFDGESCPYVKPWGTKKYANDMGWEDGPRMEES